MEDVNTFIKRNKRIIDQKKALIDLMGKFMINDVVIRSHLAAGSRKIKYRVIHIDEYGMPYIRQIKIDGTLCEAIICPYLNTEHTYKHDPDWLDYLLLNSESNYKPYDRNKR